MTPDIPCAANLCGICIFGVTFSSSPLLYLVLHADLFSRHTSPVEVYVFLAVDERGEDVMFDEIGRRCNGKQQRRRRGGRSVQLPDWVMNKIRRQHNIDLTWVTKVKSLS